MPDLVIANARLVGRPGPVDVAIGAGQVLDIEPSIRSEAPRFDAGEGLLSGGFVDCHIHLDKALILDRTKIIEGTLAEAVRETARAKVAFTIEDVHRRASEVVHMAIRHGTIAMRTFVEIDPSAGLRSFEAVKAVRAEFADRIDIEICAFAQDGLTNSPETEPLLVEALRNGADLVGGCTYTDPDPAEHVRRIFALAERFGTAVDFHVDFDLDPEGSDLPAIIAETTRLGFQHQVVCGHVTKLAAFAPDTLDIMGKRLADAGVGVVALPATDFFLLGRGADGVAPLVALDRLGVCTAIATNNVQNAFTPYGDASLVRMANLFANVVQLGRDDELAFVFDMIGRNPATLLQRPFGVRKGYPADLLLLDAASPEDVIRRISPVRAAWKAGRQTT